MGGEWREVTVEEIKASDDNALATGPFGSSIASRFFVSSGVPVIRGANLSGDVGIRLIDDGLVFLSADKAKDFARATVRAGDLVFTCWGTVNQVGLIDKRAAHPEYVISNKQMKLTPDPLNADSLFLYYLFSGPEFQARIASQAIGSSVPGFNLGQLRAMQLQLPELAEQRSIAHVLGTLDDKVAVNRRMSETLEAIARALFKAWFVDFERSEDSEDRGAGTLADYATLSTESWRKEAYPEAIRYVDLSNTKFGRIESVAYHTRRDAPSRAQRVLRSGDTIVGTVRPGNGSYALISEEGLTGSTGFAVLRPRTETCREFVYLASTAAENIDRLSHLADGGAYPAVRPETVLDTRVVAASAEMIGAFSKLTRPLLARIARSERESLALTVLRDALLPKLISGELRVRDAERLLERVP